MEKMKRVKRKYAYTCPTKDGYVKFKVSRKQHNKLKQTIKENIFTKIEAFY